MNDLDKNNKTFEDIKHIDENGIEFWYARELMKVLEYNKWENFEKVIALAQTYFAVQYRYKNQNSRPISYIYIYKMVGKFFLLNF